VALLSARERVTHHSAGREGLAGAGAPLTVYASSEAHSSVDKGMKLAGYGLEQLRRVPVDECYAMLPDALARMIAADLEAGLRPACVVATVGTTSSTAIDPLARIAEVCRRHGVWLHVDAAYGGAAAIVPELRHLFDGVEHADSFVFNPHKWMLVNFDCSAYFVRDREALLRTFQVSPEYLRTAADAEVVNFRDWGIQLGRRFRALKLWFVIRSYGVDGLQGMVRKHVALARELAGCIEASADFELMAPAPLGLVCFRYHPASIGADDSRLDEVNSLLLARVNGTRRVHLTHTRLGGRYAIRMAIGQRQTEREHVEDAWGLIREAAVSS
jgi:aromatic-L-amino-acid/L-tryptophan decarboxylase